VNKRQVEARTYLVSALDAFDAIGAAPWAEQARMECGDELAAANKRVDVAIGQRPGDPIRPGSEHHVAAIDHKCLAGHEVAIGRG
jgi:hypothetical protein